MKYILILFVLYSLSGAEAKDLPGASSAPKRPNIILFSIDTLRADFLSRYGYRKKTSPSIDEFANDSVLFAKAFSQAPITTPAHMSIFTSLSSPVHRVNNISPEGINHILGENITTLPQVLKKAGYLNVGFHGGGQVAGELGFSRGFDEYLPLFGNWENLGARPDQLDMVTGRIKKRLRDCREKGLPLFLFLHHYLCHDPYLKGPSEIRTHFLEKGVIGLPLPADPANGHWKNISSESFWQGINLDDPAHLQYIVSLYEGGVFYSDYVFKKLVEILKEEDIYDDSMIILLSDHGEEFNEHGGKLHGFLWIEHVQVPLIVKFPGGKFAGMVIEESVRTMDVMPTVLEWLNIPLERPVQGISFLPLLTKRGIYKPIIASYGTKSHHEVIKTYSLRIHNDDYTFIDHNDPTDALLDFSQAEETGAVEAFVQPGATTANAASLGYISTGNSCFRIDDFGNAFEMYKQALFFSQTDTWIYVQMAACCRELNRTPEAELLLAKALEIDPESYLAFLEWGRCSIELNQFEKALKILKDAQRLEPCDPRAYFEEGRIYELQEKYQEAESAYKKAAELASAQIDYHVALARLYKEQREYELSISEYKEILKKNPGAIWIFKEYTTVCRTLGMIENAIQTGHDLLKLDPAQTWLYQALGNYYEKHEQIDEEKKLTEN